MAAALQAPLETVVLLPGLLCDAAVWAPQCAGLAAIARCHVPAWGALDSLEAMAEHVLASAPAQRFSLAGHSMGGRVALEVVRRAPERVTRLALLDTGFHPLPEGAAGEAERAGRMALLVQAQRAGMREMGRQWARGMVHAERVDTPLFEQILQMIERSTPAIFEAQIRALLARPDAGALLLQIRCATLLLCGRDDHWSPLARHEQMQAAMPHARLVVVENAGHMTTMERPEAVTDAMTAWLSGPTA